MTGQLSGRTAIVTGANQGFGLAMSRAMIAAGANLVICAREADRLAEAAEGLRRAATTGQRIIDLRADVSRLDDVERLVVRALDEFGRIHILVNNAGIYGPIGAIEDVDWDDWVRAIEINLFGSALMCRALIPHFKQHRYGKIVQVSGGGATNPLARITSYAASKAAVVRLAESLALELSEFGIDVNSIAPGLLNTRLLDQAIEAGPDRIGQAFYERMVQERAKGTTPLEIGASLAVYLASAESDGITGRLISAVWDPWRDLAVRRHELAGSDIYTLRRITPADRGKVWAP